MVRIGMTCLVVLWLAGCVAPVSLDEDLQPSSDMHINATSVPISSEEVAPGKVQVWPIDTPSTDGQLGDMPLHEKPALMPESPVRERLRGVLSAQGWQLCGQNQPKEIRISSGADSEVASFLTHRPIFFLDGWGRVLGNEIELERVERMVVEGPGCREPLESFAWVAHGRAPYWAFAVTSVGMQLRTRGEAPRNYPATAVRSEDDQIVYEGRDYRLTLRRQTCVDATRTDAHYAWTAELHTSGQIWHGCAWRGMQEE